MIAKSLIAAGAIAASLAATVPAKAGVDVDVDVNIGGGYGGYYAPVYGYGYGPISCRHGGNIVRNHNFHHVRAIDCHLPGYRYIGWRYGKKFVIRLNGAGHITSVARVF